MLARTVATEILVQVVQVELALVPGTQVLLLARNTAL